MGKKFAPAYANIFMAAWEETVWRRSKKKPLHYFRYLDDIWGVWTDSQTSFDDWVELVNSINPSITLKATFHEQQVDFLDTTTYKGDQFHITHKLETKVYFKPTDTHALLFKTSHHPKHTFLGIIKSQLLRFHRICSRREDFEEATRVLFQALSRRGYSRSIRRRAYRTYLDTRTTISNPTPLPIILDYSASTLQLTRTIKRHLEITQKQLQHLSQYRLIAAFRKGKNLRDLLVRSKPPPAVNRPRRRKTQLLKLKWVRNSTTNRTFTIQQHKDNTKNLIYLLTCATCGMKYVGETRNDIGTRLYQHKYNVINKVRTETPVVKHFINHGWPAARATILDTHPFWSHRQRRTRERHWIQQLGTIQPAGLNEKFSTRSEPTPTPRPEESCLPASNPTCP